VSVCVSVCVSGVWCRCGVRGLDTRMRLKETRHSAIATSAIATSAIATGGVRGVVVSEGAATIWAPADGLHLTHSLSHSLTQGPLHTCM
jgi:hypothetical protein